MLTKSPLSKVDLTINCRPASILGPCTDGLFEPLDDVQNLIEDDIPLFSNPAEVTFVGNRLRAKASDLLILRIA